MSPQINLPGTIHLSDSSASSPGLSPYGIIGMQTCRSVEASINTGGAANQVVLEAIKEPIT